MEQSEGGGFIMGVNDTNVYLIFNIGIFLSLPPVLISKLKLSSILIVVWLNPLKINSALTLLTFSFNCLKYPYLLCMSPL